MPHLIFKCPHIKGGTKSTVTHLVNYVKYMAIRNGVDRIDPGRSGLPATKKQNAMVKQILCDFPISRGMFEYEDYLAAPTRGNASDFITRALEDNYDQVAKRENYLKYIATRPHSQRIGSHGLFTGSEDPLTLSQVAKGIAEHPGHVWLPILSLRREDAARLGYDKAESWKQLLSGYAMELAQALKIPWRDFRWYAAFHDESHHPHVHMVCYSADPSKGFLTKQGITDIKSGLVKEIFRQELVEIYQQQTQSRNVLIEDARIMMDQMIEQMQSCTMKSSRIEQLMAHLAERLRRTSGKKQYGYLKAPLKALVDEIVDELAKDSSVSAAYDLWYELRESVLHTYKNDLPQRLPLSQQKEFKRIKNIVIEEAVKLGIHQQIFCPTEQEEPADTLAQESTLLSEQLTPYSDPEPLPEPISEETAPTSSHMTWSKTYRLARRYLFGSEEQPQDFERAFTLFQEEARQGNALAMHDLGRMFADGLGCEIDMQSAHEWYAKALDTFHTVEQTRKNCYTEYRIGKLYAAGLGCKQDYNKAAQWFQLAADEEYKYAQYSLANLFRQGHGVEQDSLRAVELYTSSAQQGFPYAAYELGKMYRAGDGCSQNDEESENWYRRAFGGFLSLESQSHDDKVQYRIGWMLLHGIGTDKNEYAARKWFEKASKAGNPHAQYQLAQIVLNNPSSEHEQIEQTLEWLSRMADAGHDRAQYALGKMYRDGQFVTKNINKAAKLFTLAAEQENTFASFALGKLYLAGDEAFPKDITSALQWLNCSAESGNQFAQYYLGKLLLKGSDGILQDAETAIRWLTAAAGQKNKYAEYSLALVYLNGEGVLKDNHRALRLLKRSANQGNQFAQYRLGKLLLQGEEVPKDIRAAIHWLTAATTQGNQYAQYALGKLYLLGKEVPKDRDTAVKLLRLSADQGNEYAQYFLDHMDDLSGQASIQTALTLLRHLSNIFREQSLSSSNGIQTRVDKKLLQKIKAKKIAQGHKADDHESEMNL